MRAFNPQHIPLPKSTPAELLKIQNSPRLVVEIGCGVGLHPIQYANLHPEQTLIAFEHTHEKFQKFYRRYLNHQTPVNLLPIHGNAISWLTHIFTAQSLEQIFLLYPNPFPKKGDLNKRWHAMPFMQQLKNVLKPQGLLTIATNELFYADEACEYMTEQWNFRLSERLELNLAQTPDLIGRTHFERKYLKQGQVCYNLTFVVDP